MEQLTLTREVTTTETVTPIIVARFPVTTGYRSAHLDLPPGYEYMLIRVAPRAKA